MLNFGRPGSTVMTRHRTAVPLVTPWNSGPEYARARAAAAEVDIVVIMFGTNDAIPALWIEANYSAALLELIAEFNATARRIIVLVPPPISRAITDAARVAVVNGRLPALVPQLAAQAGVEVASPHAALLRCGAAEPDSALTCDGVHPSPAGVAHIAALLAAVIDGERFGASRSLPCDTTVACPMPIAIGTSAGALAALCLLCALYAWRWRRRSRTPTKA